MRVEAVLGMKNYCISYTLVQKVSGCTFGVVVKDSNRSRCTRIITNEIEMDKGSTLITKNMLSSKIEPSDCRNTLTRISPKIL